MGAGSSRRVTQTGLILLVVAALVTVPASVHAALGTGGSVGLAPEAPSSNPLAGAAEAVPTNPAPAAKRTGPPCLDARVLTSFASPALAGADGAEGAVLDQRFPADCSSPNTLVLLADVTQSSGDGLLGLKAGVRVSRAEPQPDREDLVPSGSEAPVSDGTSGSSFVFVEFDAVWDKDCAAAGYRVAVTRGGDGGDAKPLVRDERERALDPLCRLVDLMSADAPVDAAEVSATVLELARALGAAAHDLAPAHTVALDEAVRALPDEAGAPDALTVRPRGADAGVAPPSTAAPGVGGSAGAGAADDGTVMALAAADAATPAGDAEGEAGADAESPFTARITRDLAASPFAAGAHSHARDAAFPANAQLAYRPPALDVPATPPLATPPRAPTADDDAGAPARDRAPDARISSATGPGAPVSASEAARLVAAVAAAGVVGGLALTVVGVALYQRIARPSALNHPARVALYEAARVKGATASTTELARAAGLERKTAEYHLVYMARLGLLREEKAPDAPRGWAVPGATSRKATPAAPLDDRVLDLVARHPGITVPDLARELAATRPRVERRVKDFIIEGVLESRLTDGARRLYPADDA